MVIMVAIKWYMIIFKLKRNIIHLYLVRFPSHLNAFLCNQTKNNKSLDTTMDWNATEYRFPAFSSNSSLDPGLHISQQSPLDNHQENSQNFMLRSHVVSSPYSNILKLKVKKSIEFTSHINFSWFWLICRYTYKYCSSGSCFSYHSASEQKYTLLWTLQWMYAPEIWTGGQKVLFFVIFYHCMHWYWDWENLPQTSELSSCHSNLQSHKPQQTSTQNQSCLLKDQIDQILISHQCLMSWTSATTQMCHSGNICNGLWKKKWGESFWFSHWWAGWGSIKWST